jgi:hypothetical protein
MTANPSELQLQVFVSPTHPIGSDGLTFSPTTSTLIYGHREAILVDAQFIKNDIDELGNVIEELGVLSVVRRQSRCPGLHSRTS